MSTEKQKRIKIAYFITGLHTGGAEMMVYNLVKNLGRERYEPLIISILRPGAVGNKLRAICPVLSLNVSSKYNPMAFLRFYKILRREKPDILHTNLFHADIIGRIVGRLAGVPTIVSTIHNTNIGGKIRELLLALTSNLNNADVAVSASVAKRALLACISKNNKLRVIYNGIDTDQFSKKDRKDMRKKLAISGEPVIISIGSLTRQKGYPYLLEAFARLRKGYPNARLLILGEGPERSRLEKLARTLGIGGSIEFLGIKENVAEYLSASDIFVLASLWEGLPLVVVEAMSCEVPVVSTRFAAASEIIEDGISGLLVQSENADVLAERMRYLLELPTEEVKDMTRMAREKAVGSFSVSIMTLQYERLYTTLISLNP